MVGREQFGKASWRKRSVSCLGGRVLQTDGTGRVAWRYRGMKWDMSQKREGQLTFDWREGKSEKQRRGMGDEGLVPGGGPEAGRSGFIPRTSMS